MVRAPEAARGLVAQLPQTGAGLAADCFQTGCLRLARLAVA